MTSLYQSWSEERSRVSMGRRRGMQSMLTSLKMEAIEESDSEDASVVGADGRARLLQQKNKSSQPQSGNSPGSSRPDSVRERNAPVKKGDTFSRKESLPKKVESVKKGDLSPNKPGDASSSSSMVPKKEPQTPKKDSNPAAPSRERTVNVNALTDKPLKKASGDGDDDSLTPTEKTIDTDESSFDRNNPEAGAEVNALDMDGDACDGGLFDYDEDLLSMGDEAKEEAEETLTWRLDPELSLSDWTVELTNKTTGEVKPYHLHKNILAVGPRKCEYFAGVFRKRNQGPAANKSEISLEAPAFECFPQFLDFVYSSDGALEVTTGSATAMRHLAKSFGLKILFKIATEFLIKDIALENSVTYYSHSVILSDDKITAMVARHVSRNIQKIDPKGELILTMDPEFFLRLMAAPEIDTKPKQYHISLLLAEYCRINKERMEAAVFLRLCDEKHLPVIDHSVALLLLEMEADLVVVTTSVLKFSNITSLQKRCIKELSYHWRELSEVEREDVAKVCRKLPSGVVTDLLVKSLSQAKRKMDQAIGDKNSLSKKLLDSDSSQSSKFRDRDNASVGVGSSSEGPPRKEPLKLAQARKDFEAKAADLKREHQEEMAHLKKEYETNLLKLRDLCLEKDKHIANYWQELQRYVRMPNTPEGKFGPSGMMNKVTKMPEIGNTSSEGHLYTVKKDGAKRYPMFYYQAD